MPDFYFSLKVEYYEQNRANLKATKKLLKKHFGRKETNFLTKDIGLREMDAF